MTASEKIWTLPNRRITFSGRPLLMGIVNVTPDSFSDAGLYATTARAVAHGMELIEEGADLLDIGGESTRPGALEVAREEELRRVVPVVAELVKKSSVPVSVDTSKAEVARACLDEGAEIINDVTALTADPGMVEVARKARAGVVLMHMQGTPRTMQQNPHYNNVVQDITGFLQQRIEALVRAGIDKTQMVVDPGIGFGKTIEHNLEILVRLEEFQKIGRPLCLGVSRKGFIGKILGRPVDQRVAGSLAILCHAMSKNAVQIIRVHDVAATRDVVVMWKALTDSGPVTPFKEDSHAGTSGTVL